MSEQVQSLEVRKAVIKSMIKALHSGADPQEMVQRFQQVLHGVSPTEIAQIEQELIEEGMPQEEVRRLCDVHLAVFRESLEKAETLAPAGHPINILMAEHRLMLEQAQELARLAQGMASADDAEAADFMQQVRTIAEHLRESESHYLREENVLFPYLEKHGIKQPPAIMWMEHDQIRQVKKGLYGVIDSLDDTSPPEFGEELEAAAVTLAETVAGHFYKENRVLFPTAMRVIEPQEWPEIRSQFDELGYTPFTPERPPLEGVAKPVDVATAEGLIRLGTGTLSLKELEGILNTLPLDITFVDKGDRVRYFNDISDRIFPRARAILGRTVQRCHPQKSLHVVNEILQGFRDGSRDEAEFWLQREGKFVHIVYRAVRDPEGQYLGCLEVMQDATRLRQLEGEKRLL